MLFLNPLQPEPAALDAVRRHLDSGGVVAMPTDTVYGLVANASDAEAVGRVFALKGRSFQNPLPLVVRDLAQAAEIACALPPVFATLTAAFWPGPLTLIVAAGERLAPAVTAGTGNVGMRQPNLPLLAQLLAGVGYPLTATSANRSGQPECRTGAAVAAQLDGEGLLVVEGGLSPLALPSTILDLTGAGTPRLVRAGAIATSDLEACLGAPIPGSIRVS